MAALKWDLIALIALLSFTMGSAYRIQAFSYDTPATKPRTLDEITDNPDLASVRHTHGGDAVSTGSYFGGSGGGNAPGFGGSGGGYGHGGGNSGGGGGGGGWSGGGAPSYGAPGFGGNNGGGCGYGGGYGDGGHAPPGGIPPIPGMPGTGGPFYCQPSSCGNPNGHDCPGFTMHLTHHAPPVYAAEDDSSGKIRDAMAAPESG